MDEKTEGNRKKKIIIIKAMDDLKSLKRENKETQH